MSKINSYLMSLFLAVLLMECAVPGGIPSNYLVHPRDVHQMTTGCWISITKTEIATGEVSPEFFGELIASQYDTFYVLTPTSVVLIPKDEIKTATLYLYKDQTGKYLQATGLGLLPNLAGVIIHAEPGFLLMGIPFAVVGVLTAVLEDQSNELRFPKKNKLEEFVPFSRFPQGIPSGVELGKLILRIDTLESNGL